MILTNEQISAQSGYIAGSVAATRINEQMEIFNKKNINKINNVHKQLLISNEDTENEIKKLKEDIHILKKICKKLLKKTKLN